VKLWNSNLLKLNGDKNQLNLELTFIKKYNILLVVLGIGKNLKQFSENKLKRIKNLKRLMIKNGRQ